MPKNCTRFKITVGLHAAVQGTISLASQATEAAAGGVEPKAFPALLSAHVPHFWRRWALRITGGKGTPLLGKEGWLRPLRKCREASLAGADGVVGSATDDRKLNRPPPAAPIS